jgi:uncharacterized protein (TIGR03083 family)
MESPPATAPRAFEEAVGFLLATAERVRPEQWNAPALGEWSVRDLVGHASRALITTEAFLQHPATTVDFATPADYMVGVLAQPGAAARVAQSGREAGAALGDEPLAALRALAARVLPLAAAADGAQPITTPAGGTRLADYLATRVFELTTHTLDLADAIGAAVEPPPAAACLALYLASDMAVRTGKAPDMLLALTGRRPLPAGFSLV